MPPMDGIPSSSPNAHQCTRTFTARQTLSFSSIHTKTCHVQIFEQFLCTILLKLASDDVQARGAALHLLEQLQSHINSVPKLKLPTEQLVRVLRENSECPHIANQCLPTMVTALKRCKRRELRSLVRSCTRHFARSFSRLSCSHIVRVFNMADDDPKLVVVLQ